MKSYYENNRSENPWWLFKSGGSGVLVALRSGGVALMGCDSSNDWWWCRSSSVEIEVKGSR